MSTELITNNIWKVLTNTIRASSRPCSVAVAYFGKGASQLVPLKKGDRLVVDASDRAVTSGQTCPDDLLKLAKRGVRVFSVENLHAKVFVLDKVAYVGSTNASNHSASRLVEAIVRTTDARAVKAARKFVNGLCLHELTPDALRRLGKIYKPPKIPAGDRGKKAPRRTLGGPALPRIHIAQIDWEVWSDEDQVMHDQGEVVAQKRLKNPDNCILEDFRVTGTHSYRPRDLVVQVTNEGGGKHLVSPPGNVLYIRKRKKGNCRVAFIYLERPNRRRRDQKTLARHLGPGALKRLRKDGEVRGAAFKKALLQAFTK